MKFQKNLIIGFLAIVVAIGFGFSKGVSPVASQEDIPLIEVATDWSPDGSQILFGSNRAGNFDIWVVNPDGSNMTNLTSEYSSGDGYAFWSPDGKTIAFRSDRESTKSEDGLPNVDLWIMESDGTNPSNLTSDIEESVDVFAWSPNSNRLAFVVTQTNFETMEFDSEIWILELTTGEKSRIDPFSEGDDNSQNYRFAYPIWTPDNRLVFTIEAERPVGIGILNLNADDEFQEIPIGPIIAYIDLAPEGSSIVCTSFLSIILVNIRSGEVVELVSGLPGVTADPKWSPDGSRIAFRSSDGDSSDIWVVSPDSSDLTNLTADYDSFASFPVWSPNGEQIAFVSDRSGESNIWIMNADGSNPINLTGNATQN